jgi:hypothetical protein
MVLTPFIAVVDHVLAHWLSGQIRSGLCYSIQSRDGQHSTWRVTWMFG